MLCERQEYVNNLGITFDNVVENLFEWVPEFQRQLNLDSVVDNENGEVLSHPLFSELVYFSASLCALISQGDESAREILERIMAFLEVCANSADVEVVNLVMVSYCEHMPKPDMVGEHYHCIVSRMGSKTLELLDRIDRFWAELFKRRNRPTTSRSDTPAN